HREWPRRRRAAKRDKQFSPPDVDCHVTLPWGSCNGWDHITPSRAALRDFKAAYVCCGSDSVVRRCRLNVRFARKRTRLKGAHRLVLGGSLTCPAPLSLLP